MRMPSPVLAFSQSSTRPRIPTRARVASGAKVDASIRRRTIASTPTVAISRSPPAVGVPAFAWWPSGPSMRICLANPAHRTRRM